MTVIGNYHNESASPRVIRPNRVGGDDEIQGALVAKDLVRALRQSHGCRRFLRNPLETTKTFMPLASGPDIATIY